MAINNYTDLQSVVADWLNRTDLTARIPDFIALTEAEIRRRLRRKTIRATIDIIVGETGLLAEIAELRSIALTSGQPYQDKPLDVTTWEVVAEHRASRGGVAGRPVMAAVYADAIVVSPEPDQTYTANVVYFQKLVSLSGEAPVNATLLESPDLYLYGALKHSAAFLQHDERLATWSGLFEDALDRLEQQRSREETAASIRRVRFPVVFG